MTTYIGEPPKSIVDHNLRCFSCSDQPQKIVSAFKMACLSYKPGKVEYKGHEISRDALITVNDGILKKLDENQQEATRLVRDLGLQMAREKESKLAEQQNKGGKKSEK